MLRMTKGMTVAFSLGLAAAALASGGADKSWSVKAVVIEACSCHLMCPCYFKNKDPEREGAHHCETNAAIRISDNAFYGNTNAFTCPAAGVFASTGDNRRGGPTVCSPTSAITVQ